MGKEWHPSSLTEPTGPRARTTKRTVLRIVKAAESTYFYGFTNLLSAMVKKGKQNHADVRRTRYYILGGEILVGGDTVIEQEVVVLKASRNTLMALNAWETCNFFAHLRHQNGFPHIVNGVVCCVKSRNPIALLFQKIYRFKFYVIKLNPQDPFSYRTFHVKVYKRACVQY